MAISFDGEQQNDAGGLRYMPQTLKGMSGWLVRKGLAANQTSADLTLVLIAGVCIALAVFVPYILGGQSSSSVDESKIRAAINPFPIPKPSSQMP